MTFLEQWISETKKEVPVKKENIFALLNLVLSLPIQREDIIKSVATKYIFQMLLNNEFEFCRTQIEKVLAKYEAQNVLIDTYERKKKKIKLTWANQLVQYSDEIKE
jgi:hypothetical protein